MSSGNTGRYSAVRHESAPHVEETDPEVLSVAQTAATFKPGVRVPWVIVSMLVTGLVSIVCTYMTTHSTPADAASRSELHKLDEKFDVLTRDLAALTATVNSNADREHNDLEILKSAVYKK